MEKELIIECEDPKELIELAKNKLENQDFTITQQHHATKKYAYIKVEGTKKITKTKTNKTTKISAPLTILTATYYLLTGNATILPLTLLGGIITTTPLILKEKKPITITIEGISVKKANHYKIKTKIKGNTEKPEDYYYTDMLEDEYNEFYDHVYQSFIKHKEIKLNEDKRTIKIEKERIKTKIKNLEEEHKRGIINKEEYENQKNTLLREQKKYEALLKAIK